jgi:hypothetical protein
VLSLQKLEMKRRLMVYMTLYGGLIKYSYDPCEKFFRPSLIVSNLQFLFDLA